MILNTKKTNNYILLLFIIIILCFLTYIFVSDGKKIENITGNNSDADIVIARYNESLEWLNDDKYKKYKIICYNSGDNEDFYKPDNMKIVKIENIGKEAFVYLYHIITNYDNLANVTVFLPGSCEDKQRTHQLNTLMNELDKNKNTIFISSEYSDVKKELYDFKIDEYCSTNKNNFKTNSKCKLNPSSVRPFGKWYETMFGKVKTTHVNYRGLLVIHKKHILQKNKEFYEKLILELKHPNDEVSHYFERSWEAIFYPINDAIFINLH